MQRSNSHFAVLAVVPAILLGIILGMMLGGCSDIYRRDTISLAAGDAMASTESR